MMTGMMMTDAIAIAIATAAVATLIAIVIESRTEDDSMRCYQSVNRQKADGRGEAMCALHSI